jgi:hypothetical protein
MFRTTWGYLLFLLFAYGPAVTGAGFLVYGIAKHWWRFCLVTGGIVVGYYVIGALVAWVMYCMAMR